ncbi:MAG: hypothetical protein ACOYM3_30365, partial [Terrimicrobiaceae bacterium]
YFCAGDADLGVLQGCFGACSPRIGAANGITFWSSDCPKQQNAETLRRTGDFFGKCSKKQPGLDSSCPAGLYMTSKMTSRQRLNQVLLSVTGEDIRLVGNWERLPALFGNAEQLAERLNVTKVALLRCQDIADVLGLMENGPSEGSSDNQFPLL